MSLSVVMITRNCRDVGEVLDSIEGLWDELLVSDQNSTDGTQKVLEQYNGTIVETKSDNLGKRKQDLVKKAKNDWILVLDSDERVSLKLYEEIKKIDKKYFAYRIPYQNYVFGKPVYWGGERYGKIRLFRRGYGRVTPVPIHEEVIVDGSVGELRGVIHHHSYRTSWQLFEKFTHYAWITAQEKKKNDESTTPANLFLYGPHMFWARFVEERGYKDGLTGFILAFAFSYMETLTYWILLFL